MSIKDKIKGAFQKKAQFTVEGEEEQTTIRQTAPKGDRLSKKKPEAKFSYETVEPKQGTQYSPEDEADIQARVREHIRNLTAEISYEGEGKPPRELSKEEKRILAEEARAMAEGNREEILQRIREEQEAIRQGVPLTEQRTTWERAPGEKKARQVIHELRIPGYERRFIAAKTRAAVEGLRGQAEGYQQEAEINRVLYPTRLQEAESAAKEAVRQSKFERETLAPTERKIIGWEAQKALDRVKKEQFARTPKGRALNVAGKLIDKGTSGLGQGIGYGAIGIGMALRSGPSVSTSYLTGVYSPQRQNMWTPAAQAHGQTWIQAGRALTPTGKAPAGRALGATNVPAGMAMLPNLKNLNPALTIRPMGLGIGSSRLSPLPRRRQPRQQTEPGASRVR